MNCFEHKDMPAIAACKYCCKGVCLACVNDTGVGVACGERCAEEVKGLDEFVKLNQRLVMIGRQSKATNGSFFFLFFFCLAFGGFAIYRWWVTGEVEWFLVIMAGGFGFSGFLNWSRLKRVGYWKESLNNKAS